LSMPISSTAGVAVGDALAALVAAAVGSDNKATHALGWPPYWVE
jgi:ethanolamine utilization microcompartment shell protein EutL